jgi:molybdopterin/thiamine biosynthesis adenylyltransferase
MSALDPQALSRTVKLELDEGRASTLAAAIALAESYVLHIDVGPLAATSATVQATLLTAVASAVRPFLGGVKVKGATAVPVLTAHCKDQSLLEVVEQLGATTVNEFTVGAAPVLFIGYVGLPPESADSAGAQLYVQANGWIASARRSPAETGVGFEMELAGMLAGALGVSEAFQHVRGDTYAMRRNVEVSLWDPASLEVTQGPSTYVLPSKLWLVGLGHLGQAYAWALSMLPYRRPGDVLIVLQDDDMIVEANHSTGLLSEFADIGQLKTRVVARHLESVGLNTRIVERRFDAETAPKPSDPAWVVGGLDDVHPRRWLQQAGFNRYIDAGIGDTIDTYLDIMVQTSPSQLSLDETFPVQLATRNSSADAPAYRELEADAMQLGMTAGEAHCGVLELAGRSVGVPFVGAAASCFVIADVLRALNGAPEQLAVFNFDLRSPMTAAAARNTKPGPVFNPGYTDASV